MISYSLFLFLFFSFYFFVFFFFFFFQAEDGIRDPLVTGVQTCALPILPGHGALRIKTQMLPFLLAAGAVALPLLVIFGWKVFDSLERAVTRHAFLSAYALNLSRSEERRVGKECSYRWSPCSEKQSNRTQ